MVFRLFGVLINKNRPISLALSNIFGIGFSEAEMICCRLNISKFTLLKDLSPVHLSLLYQIIEKYNLILSDRNFYVINNINLLKKNKSYKGVRHLYKLPVNGQRTHSNASTARKLLF